MCQISLYAGLFGTLEYVRYGRSLLKEENDWIKSVLNVINPKDGTDYWIGGLDADKDKGMQWMTGKL